MSRIYPTRSKDAMCEICDELQMTMRPLLDTMYPLESCFTLSVCRENVSLESIYHVII